MLPCLKGDTLVDAAGVVEVWQPCLVCKPYIRVNTVRCVLVPSSFTLAALAARALWATCIGQPQDALPSQLKVAQRGVSAQLLRGREDHPASRLTGVKKLPRLGLCAKGCAHPVASDAILYSRCPPPAKVQVSGRPVMQRPSGEGQASGGMAFRREVIAPLWRRQHPKQSCAAFSIGCPKPGQWRKAGEAVPVSSPKISFELL